MIEVAEIAALAELYDHYAHALERQSPDRQQARRQFHARLEMLYEREHAGVPYETFRFEMVRRCKAYLTKN